MDGETLGWVCVHAFLGSQKRDGCRYGFFQGQDDNTGMPDQSGFGKKK